MIKHNRSGQISLNTISSLTCNSRSDERNGLKPADFTRERTLFHVIRTPIVSDARVCRCEGTKRGNIRPGKAAARVGERRKKRIAKGEIGRGRTREGGRKEGRREKRE